MSFVCLFVRLQSAVAPRTPKSALRKVSTPGTGKKVLIAEEKNEITGSLAESLRDLFFM